MAVSETYQELYMRLGAETAVVIFIKANAEVRLMLATRSLQTANLAHGFLSRELAKMDSRCNIANGNIGVIDLEIGEGRQFKMERIIDVHWLGEIRTEEDYAQAFKEFLEFKNNYLAKKAKTIDFDTFD